MRMHAERGMSLIDTIVGSALMLVVFIGIAGAFQLALDVVTSNKARAGAIALADERMEYIRSLPYNSIGTVGGVPSGTIAQSENVAMNGVTYTRRTTILYTDDPGDGIGVSDTNNITTDYKAARVEVSWPSRVGTRSIVIVTRIEPKNGLEIACTSCGTLTVNVVDASSSPLPNAQVRVTNASTSPAVDITTFTDSNGVVSIVGAPAAAGYQVIVSGTGYSTAQTYPSTPSNPNPNPGNLTVADGQTTSATFAIDRVATKTIYTWTQVQDGSWVDSLANASKIASSTNIDVGGGEASLSGSPGSYSEYGEFESIAAAPAALSQWSSLEWVAATSSSAHIRAQVYDGVSGVLVPDSEIPGNSAGSDVGSLSLVGVSTSTHPSLVADFIFSSIDSSETPTLDQYSFTYQYGPVPLPNISFSMQGAKQIGSGPPILYKYDQTLSTGASGHVALSSIEWDSYTITVPSSTGYDVASACNPQPELLQPGTNVVTNLYLTTHTSNSLLVDVSSAGAPLPGASVSIWKSGIATTTLIADQCSQAFFGSLSGATYWVQVSLGGYTTYINTNAVSGTTRLSVVL